MKRKLQIAVIALFIFTIWLPLLCTPFRFQKERETLRAVEKRAPGGTLSLKECKDDIEHWVEELQVWFRDSFAFRSKLMGVYNLSHYLVRNYPEEICGRSGHLFPRDPIQRKLKPIKTKEREHRSINLGTLRRVCTQADIPCLFVLIPSKETVHPRLAPRWIQNRSSTQRRDKLVALIRTNHFPVLDLSAALKNEAEETGRILFRKYDFHWNIDGALVGYREMISEIKKFIPETRLVAKKNYTLKRYEHVKGYSKRLYLDSVLSEPLGLITQIDLPPVRVVTADGEQTTTIFWASRFGAKEVFCPELGSQTVLFIRDSFLTLPSQMLNHSFAHTVYLDHSEKGRNPFEVIENDHPDLLVIALQENSLGRYLSRIDE